MTAKVTTGCGRCRNGRGRCTSVTFRRDEGRRSLRTGGLTRIRLTEPAPDKREVRRETRRLKDAQAEAMVRFSYAPGIPERDAAEADYERVTAELRALTGKGGFADWGDR